MSERADQTRMHSNDMSGSGQSLGSPLTCGGATSMILSRKCS